MGRRFCRYLSGILIACLVLEPSPVGAWRQKRQQAASIPDAAGLFQTTAISCMGLPWLEPYIPRDRARFNRVLTIGIPIGMGVGGLALVGDAILAGFRLPSLLTSGLFLGILAVTHAQGKTRKRTPYPNRNLDWSQEMDRPVIWDFFQRASGTDFLRLASDDPKLLAGNSYVTGIRAILKFRPLLDPKWLRDRAEIDPLVRRILELMRTAPPELVRITDADIQRAANTALLTADLGQLEEWRMAALPGAPIALVRHIARIREDPQKAGVRPGEMNRPLFWMVHIPVGAANWVRFMDYLYAIVAGESPPEAPERGRTQVQSGRRAEDQQVRFLETAANIFTTEVRSRGWLQMRGYWEGIWVQLQAVAERVTAKFPNEKEARHQIVLMSLRAANINPARLADFLKDQFQPAHSRALEKIPRRRLKTDA